MLRLQYAALSDVGRVRRDNQDSGYAGPWLLTVCDGVGGSARGDIASSTAVDQLRKLDQQPTDDLLGAVAGALHRAHDRLAELVDEDPALNGTSTTATVALFDGARVGVGHVGDSRAYLLRAGELSQLTKDHTFVQSLIDEGRISEEESRVHPHRNLILKALDGVHEAEPDLFVLDLVAGDRLLLCSDGASGVLSDARLAEVLSEGTPDYAAVELVRSSLEAGSSDNVTCVVADVVESDGSAAVDIEGEELEPLLVGAAAELRRKPGKGARGPGLFRGHRAGDTGELDPVPGEVVPGTPGSTAARSLDPEQARYAPRPPARFSWLRRLLVLVAVLGLIWIAAAVAYSWSQRQYYVGVADDQVVIFRGIDADLPGLTLAEPYETTDVDYDRLPDHLQRQLVDGMDAGSVDRAEDIVRNLAAEMSPEETPAPAPSESPSPSPTTPTTSAPAVTG